MVDRSLVRVGAKVRVGCYSREYENGLWRTIVAVHEHGRSQSGMTIDVTPGARRTHKAPGMSVGIDIGWITEVAT